MDLLSVFGNGLCLSPLFIGTIVLTLLNQAWVHLTKRNGIDYLHSNTSEPNTWLFYILAAISAIFIFPILLLTIYNIHEYNISDILIIGAWITMSSILFGLIRLGTYEFLSNRLFLLFSWLGTIALTEYGLLSYARVVGGTPTLLADALTILGVIFIGAMTQVTITRESEFYGEIEREGVLPEVEPEIDSESREEVTQKPNTEKKVKKSKVKE